MIRVIAVGDVEASLLQKVCSKLYQVFGVGCEAGPALPMPASRRGRSAKAGLDAAAFLEQAHSGRNALQKKDIVLYVTTKALSPIELPTGISEQPSSLSLPDKRCGVVSLDKLPQASTPERLVQRASKLAVHEVGHLLGLRHCVEAKCTMYPPWTPAFTASEAIQLCAFCQDRCERRLEGE